jgi:hypothetical protein
MISRKEERRLEKVMAFGSYPGIRIELAVRANIDE